LNPLAERLKRSRDRIDVWLESEALALIDPFAGTDVASPIVAAAACCDLVFNPARSTLHSRYEMVGGCSIQADLDCLSAPDAFVAISFENRFHSFAAIHAR